MKIICTIVFLLICTATQTFAIDANSCSLSDVNTAIGAASPGDTVNVPAGDCEWSSGITISGIKLIGAGKDGTGTNITATGPLVININGHSTEKTRLEGFRFVYANTGNKVSVNVDSNISYEPVIIYNIYISYTGGGDHSTSGTVNVDCAYGVMSNVDILNICGEVVYVTCSDNDTWNANPGPVNFGSDEFFFIEDGSWLCNQAPAAQHAIMSDDAGKTVARYNTIQGPQNIDSHGWCNVRAGSYGTRATEIYENTWSDVGGKSNVVHFRGGPGYVWGNTVIGASANYFIRFFEYRLHYDTSLCAYRGCPGVYPAGQQIGYDLKAGGTYDVDADYELRPIYMWGNDASGSIAYRLITPGTGECDPGPGGGTSANFHVGTELFDEEDAMVAEGLDANKPGTCTDNYGYWATDTQILYTCSANVWVNTYEPYTYPHPLISGTTTPPTIGTPGGSFSIGAP